MPFSVSDLAAADAAASRFGCGLHPELRARIRDILAGTAPDGRPVRQAGPAQAASPGRIAADPGLAAFPGPKTAPSRPVRRA